MADDAAGRVMEARPAEPNMSRRALFGLGFLRVLPEQLLGPEPAPGRAPAKPRVDIDALKDRAREAWSMGDYRELGAVLEPAAEAVAEASELAPGRRLLDVGAGDGNLALAAARRGAAVTACDLCPQLVHQGRRRTEAAGLETEWLEADAEELPFADERFDVVGSCFGAMYAPRPPRVTSELFRVIRPGGMVVMANWAPSGFMGRFLTVVGQHLGHPREVPRPAQWGRYETVYREFLAHTDEFDSLPRTLPISAQSRRGMWERLVRHPGELAAGLPRLEDEARARLEDEVLALVDTFGREQPDARWVIDLEYELVVGRKPDVG